MEQAIQLLGSLLILVPFVLTQLRRLTTVALGYLLPNLVGSVILAVDAGLGNQWGFLLLESVWAVVSLGGLLRVVRGGDVRPSAT